MPTDNDIIEEEDFDFDSSQGIPIPVLTNELTQFKIDTIRIIYSAIAKGELGYMDAKDPETGEIVPLLVGIEYTEGGNFIPYPIARFINGKDVFKDYLVPNGSGEYYAADDAGDGSSSEAEGGETERLHKEQNN